MSTNLNYYLKKDGVERDGLTNLVLTNREKRKSVYEILSFSLQEAEGYALFFLYGTQVGNSGCVRFENKIRYSRPTATRTGRPPPTGWRGR